jgi:hypothetical protein
VSQKERAALKTSTPRLSPGMRTQRMMEWLGIDP